jgi:hypothetical protein
MLNHESVFGETGYSRQARWRGAPGANVNHRKTRVDQGTVALYTRDGRDDSIDAYEYMAEPCCPISPVG